MPAPACRLLFAASGRPYQNGRAISIKGYEVVTTCEIRQRFRACGQPGIAICQYCGRSFCKEHGGRLADGQEICSRSTCQRKWEDLERHFVYREAVAVRNRERLCGHEDCGKRPSGQCSKCQGLFCLRHLEERQIAEGRGAVRARLRSSLCGHCLKRRDLWAQV